VGAFDQKHVEVRNILVCFFVEADMTIADLNEAEPCAFAHLVVRHLPESLRAEHSAADCPNHAGADPSHTLQKTTTVYSIVVRILLDPARQILSPSFSADLHLARFQIAVLNQSAKYSHSDNHFVVGVQGEIEYRRSERRRGRSKTRYGRNRSGFIGRRRG
jgi:hypothetical protein